MVVVAPPWLYGLLGALTVADSVLGVDRWRRWRYVRWKMQLEAAKKDDDPCRNGHHWVRTDSETMTCTRCGATWACKAP